MKKRDKTMYKNSFVNGAIITTIGIVITKLLGILYVIPFHAIIGEKGGALYGYAYTIYLIFMSLSSAGIPLAISKVISEYQTLGYLNAKKRAFYIGKKIALIMGLLCFIVLTLFAPHIARFVLGDLTGGNTIEDVTFVIRIISTAILVVPILSVYRGYFEGHRIMSPPSISQVIEQIVRVVVIVLGSFLILDVFNLSLGSAVGLAVFGATLGAFSSYLYLALKRLKNKKKFNTVPNKVNEPIISDKVIFKKIIIYAIPFIMIDIFKSLYSYVDMVTVVKGLVLYAGYTTSNAESVMSMLSTWAAKFNMIVLSVSTGVIVSLIPSLTKSLVEEDHEGLEEKINQGLSMVLYLMIPMSIGISFLAKPIWNLFYGASTFGPSVLSYYIFVGLISGLFTVLITTIQVLKDYKMVFVALLSGLLVKIILNTHLIKIFYNMGIAPYYGVITASILGYLTSIFICIYVIGHKFNIKFESTMKNLIDIIIGIIIMWLVLFGLSIIFPIYSDSRLMCLLLVLLYSLIGAIIYLFYTYKSGTMKTVFGDKLMKFIKKKFTTITK